MKKNNVDPHSFLSFVHDIDISWLPKDHLLKEELIKIKEKKYIFSNGSHAHIENVTKQLGIHGLFDGDFDFTRVGAKFYYQVERLNKSTTEFLIEGKMAFGEVPLTHLFHAYPNAPTKETIMQRFSVAGVNSFETMYFGEFFSDRIATLQVKHHLRPFNLGEKFKPEMVFITRYAIGDISNIERHQDVSFSTLDKGYTETGFEINKILFGFGTSLTYRYGAYSLPSFADNIAFKFTFNLQL